MVLEKSPLKAPSNVTQYLSNLVQELTSEEQSGIYLILFLTAISSYPGDQELLLDSHEQSSPNCGYISKQQREM